VRLIGAAVALLRSTAVRRVSVQRLIAQGGGRGGGVYLPHELGLMPGEYDEAVAPGRVAQLRPAEEHLIRAQRDLQRRQASATPQEP
jgi:hypothetical protein